MPSARRNKYDVEGYIPTGSEERIATSGDKDAQWGYSKKLNVSESSDGDLEMGDGHMRTSVRGGGGEGNVRRSGLAVEDKELGGWEDEKVDPNKKGHIVKTVHIDQYASNP